MELEKKLEEYRIEDLKWRSLNLLLQEVYLILDIVLKVGKN